MTMFELSLRALLFRGRSLALAGLPVFVGVVAVLIAAFAGKDGLPDAYATVGANLLVSLVVAIVALVIGGNAFDDERDGGTLPLLLATSTPRWRIVVAKFAAAWVSTVAICLPGVLGAGVLGGAAGFDTGKVWGGLLVMLVLCSGGYVALFLLLSLLSSRNLIAGLAYILIWEGSLATYATSLRNLSIGAYGRRLLAAPWTEASIPFKISDAGFVGAVIALLAFVVAAVGVSALRLTKVDASSS